MRDFVVSAYPLASTQRPPHAKTLYDDKVSSALYNNTTYPQDYCIGGFIFTLILKSSTHSTKVNLKKSNEDLAFGSCQICLNNKD